MTAVSDCFINQNGYNYSKVLKNGVRVSSSLKTEEVLEYGDRTVRTMYDAFCNGLRINGDGNCLGHIWEGSFIWHSYNKVYRILCDFGSGMINSGLKPGAFVGVYSKNCMEWMICEYGCFRYSIVIVPLYDTLGPEICQYCINHTELTTVICDTEEKLNILLDQASSTPSLKKIISICKPSSETLKLAKEKEIDILAFEDILASGSKDPRNPVPPRPEDLAFVMYTSGTTGNPKGVMLSHKNMVAVSGSANAVLEGEHFDKNDIIISFLPLAHSFEQDIEVTAFSSGASVGYTSGVITKLKDDFQLLKPTITPMVPRLLNKIYDSSVSAVEKSFIKKKIFNMAVKQKSKYVKRCIITRNTLWDKLVFSKIQKAFGGRLRILISGSAPLSEDVLFFMRCAFGCIVLEGYGQTENCGASVITAIKDSTTGHVGGPLQCAYMKVVDVPEMDYYAKNEEGEICIKGPHVMMGYYKDGKKTSETIDTDGWLHTGDIGRWLPNGALKIIDRKKHIFKLAQGEYIAPEKIENIYLRSKYVAQVFVHGESLQSCLIGIVVPDQEILESWAKSNKKTGSFQDHCLNIELKKEILQDMNKLGKSAGLHSFELVKDMYLESEPFSIANNMLTAVLKNKRNVMRKHYESHIQEMYLNLA